ncbi:CotH kinase family protein [Pseudobutyrivibrio xylanivorans]|uniref:CotH protein n=1 Tax=Pseudobutyrivibrio xylanivorans DSM 14809 TaxID=1123012 RepID=A0A1M6JG92_PSEXY|nr:CotH kinase family protein [Pseudobutyrivibrio xylanivorans]SHJ45738.1 CotH protein [Pseudobutyrivibrio xylanivorans DSM 14809]
MNMSIKIKSTIIILISLIIASVVIISGKSSEGTFTEANDLYINDELYTKITSKFSPSAIPLTTNVYFDKQPLIYDSDTNTFYYSLIENNADSYNPEAITDTGINVALHGPAIDDNTIARNTPIELIIYDNTSYSISNLICTTLPVMDIRIDDNMVSQLGLDDTFDIMDYTGSTVYLFDNRADFDGASRVIKSDAKVKRHGQTTVNYPMKGYRLSLLADKNDLDGENNKENFLGLRKDDDWILSATYKDYEKVRNVFATNLWYDSATGHNEWKVNNSTKYAFVELFFNGHYHGLYGLCYRLDSKEFKIKEGESSFKKKDWSMSELDTALTNDGNGDYLPGYQLKDGTSEDFNYLLQLYMNMNYSVEPAIIRMTSDVDNSIDLWLFYKLSQAVDNVNYGNVKNMYVSVKNSDSGIAGHKLLFTPWDMDQTFRYIGEGTTGQYGSPDYDIPIGWGTVYRLQYTGDTEINNQIKERYQELRNTTWSDECISEKIDTYEKQIYDSGAFARTRDKYKDGAYNDSNIKLSEFKTYVLARLIAMDTYINSLP